MDVEERINYLLANSHLAKSPFDAGEGVSKRSNCMGTMIYVMNLQDIFSEFARKVGYNKKETSSFTTFYSRGTFAASFPKEQRPGSVEPVHFSDFIKSRVLTKTFDGNIVAYFDRQSGEYVHVGVHIGNRLFDQSGCGGSFMTDRLGHVRSVYKIFREDRFSV